MSRGAAVAYAIGLPAGLVALLFLPAGSIAWAPGWLFLAILGLAFGVAVLVIRRVNPIIFRARSRFQAGTKTWDLVVVSIILTAIVATLPVAALDAGRFHGSAVPWWAVVAGYAADLIAVAGTTWAQAVNPFFEPGVRIQNERRHQVIDTGPYRLVRHPGYVSALFLIVGIPLSLGSLWGLVPAGLAAAATLVRTRLEDDFLQGQLAGYREYARRVRWRLVPGVW
jgi:protein-S-isoprenylcysteine O-methyltransferase Ste14